MDSNTLFVSNDYLTTETLTSIATSLKSDPDLMSTESMTEVLAKFRDNFFTEATKCEALLRKQGNIPQYANMTAVNAVGKDQAIKKTIEFAQEDDELKKLFTSEPKAETLLENQLATAIDEGIAPDNLHYITALKGMESSSFNCSVAGNAMRASLDGVTFFHAPDLTNAEQAEQATAVQIISIIYEGFGLIIGLSGISVPKATPKVLQKISKIIDCALKSSPKLARVVNRLINVFCSKSASLGDKATALFNVVSTIATYTLTLKRFIKALFSGLPWYRWAILVLKTIAFILTTVLTGGVVLVAKITLLLADAVTFTLKFTHLKLIADTLSPSTTDSRNPVMQSLFA